MSSTRNKLKIPTNKTQFFFEKINGKQLHGTDSECDDFCIRLQVRKYKGALWDDLAWKLATTDWRAIFSAKGISSANETQLVSSYRERSEGDHSRCVKSSKAYKIAMAKQKANPKKSFAFEWPKKCVLRKHGKSNSK